MGASGPGDAAPGRGGSGGPGDDGADPAEERAAGDIGSVIRGLLDDPRLRRGVSLGRLASSWERVVGPELAAESAPRAVDAGVLLVAASGPGWAAHVRFMAPEIRRRANEILGANAVRTVTVTVGLGARKRLRRNGSGAPGRPPGTPGSGPHEW